MTTPATLRKKADLWEAIFKQHPAYSDRYLGEKLTALANAEDKLQSAVRAARE